ncbi:MAG: hypothetical protein ABIT38_08275, partial [Gemmatimonadaceae bacterium]
PAPVKLLSPYRTLSVERRQALVLHDLKTNPSQRELVVRRIAARPGGFRLDTVRKRPVEQLAREVVRFNLETAAEEVALLQTLYIELEPALQIEFLEATGVPHDGASMAEELTPPFASAETVKRAALALVAAHGSDARHYLCTIVTYNAEAWPELDQVIAELPAE